MERQVEVLVDMYLNGDASSLFGGKLQRALSNQVSSGFKWSVASTPFIVCRCSYIGDSCNERI
jgi:hypothetical protein